MIYDIGVYPMKALMSFCFKLGVLSLGATAFAYRVTENQSADQLEKRLAHPYEVSISGVVKEEPKEVAAVPGQKVYQTYCSACHGYGVAGAPKTGDKSAWEKRMAQGWDTIMSHAIGGYKGMPAKGNCLTCSDEDIRTSIEYILSQSDLEGVY